MGWEVLFTRQAQKDAKKIAHTGLRRQAKALLEVLARNPFEIPQRYEKLIGDLDGAYSRRINILHRLVYQVLEKERIVKVIRLWSHYE